MISSNKYQKSDLIIKYKRNDIDKLYKEIVEKLKREGIFINKRILIVEDNEVNIRLLSELLESLGCLVEKAINGLQAIEMIKNMNCNYYDLILMDIQMPILNGYDATRMIRSLDNDDKNAIPILATTTNSDMNDILIQKEIGMNGHISKPIDLNKLIIGIKHCLITKEEFLIIN